MKRIINYSFGILLSVLALASCDTDSYKYEADSNPDTSGFFLSNLSSSYTFNFDDQQVIYIQVKRNDSTEAATATLTSDNSLFDVPTSVSFKAGQGTVSVPVTFNMEPGEETLNIEIPEDQKYEWGLTAASVKVIRNGKELSGTFVSTIYGDQWDVTVYYMGNRMYKISDCYETGYDITIVKNEDNTVSASSQYAWTYSASIGGVYIADYDTYLGTSYGVSYFNADELSFTMQLVHFIPGYYSDGSDYTFGVFKAILYLNEDVE